MGVLPAAVFKVTTDGSSTRPAPAKHDGTIFTTILKPRHRSHVKVK